MEPCEVMFHSVNAMGFTAAPAEVMDDFTYVIMAVVLLPAVFRMCSGREFGW